VAASVINLAVATPLRREAASPITSANAQHLHGRLTRPRHRWSGRRDGLAAARPIVALLVAANIL
jgi:hypothetical protein